MLIREIYPTEKALYNSVISHPQQSWEWGEFKIAEGHTVKRLGFFDQSKLVSALQVSFHKLPVIGQTVGYFPKGNMPEEEQLQALRNLGKKEQAIFIKLEPNISQKIGNPSAHQDIKQFLSQNQAVPGRPLFTKYSFILDLSSSEEQLFNQLDSKTRYNVKLASKKGVQIFENSSEAGMEEYIKILEETTKRQGFYAHTPDYFRKMWQIMGQSGILHIFNAVYEKQILVSWIVFVFNGVLYYPYGASRREHREVMASNLMMWEMIRYGKQMGCKTFDMWGALGPEPDEKSPWFGFHRFKKGYGGDLVEFLGTYDLVFDQKLYKIYRLAENIRWKLLRLKAKLSL